MSSTNEWFSLNRLNSLVTVTLLNKKLRSTVSVFFVLFHSLFIIDHSHLTQLRSNNPYSHREFKQISVYFSNIFHSCFKEGQLQQPQIDSVENIDGFIET